MGKEFVISVYLFLIKIIFNINKIFPIQKKVSFVISFEENATFLYKEMQRQRVPFKVVFLCSNVAVYRAIKNKFPNVSVYTFTLKSIKDWFTSIFHLATSKILIVDNYFPFLAPITFKNEVECIQIWHAAGALKTFGLQDKAISKRTTKAHKRFQKVYGQFHKVVVGSEKMASIFMESFGLSAKRMLPTGIPRTDFFFDNEQQKQIKAKLYEQYPLFKEKEIILYAPTFRHGQLDNQEINLDIDQLYKKLKDRFVFIIKLHPAVKVNIDFEKKYPGFIYDFSSYKNVNNILVITDYLISDYSSIPFEFAIMNKPMIFYPYDLEEYKREQGVIENYEEIIPGSIVHNTEEIVELVSHSRVDQSKIRDFSEEWNEFSKGASSKQLVQYILNKIDRLK
ncbi:CDP-glycerol glycerophosphotransferase family protein [Bacillus sp. JJ1533]|uniref:CDP-glycerol glycerophosphotransferase family protein n=1 Tax=Bacillus sp. JJ1533 TaxID=3122959 RepID=UPI002FFF79BE